jgi:hypothetical protein
MMLPLLFPRETMTFADMLIDLHYNTPDRDNPVYFRNFISENGTHQDVIVHSGSK